MRHVLTPCVTALCVVAAAVAVGCGSGTLAPPTDGAADRRDAADVAVTDARNAGPDVPDGSAAADAPGDTGDAPADNRDGPVDLPPDAITDGGAAGDVRADAGPDGGAAGDGGNADAPRGDAEGDGTGTLDAGDGGASDAGDGGASDTGDGGAPDAPTEAGRPYVERACGSTDACVCASNEDCSFECPGGGCAITCMAGSNCTVACASPFGCSVSCGNEAQCILACNLGVCAHFFGPASTLACDPAGLGCL